MSKREKKLSGSSSDEPLFLNKSVDELFWDAKGFKQCLWTVLEANKFKPLTEKQMESAWSEFNKIEAFTMSKYQPILDSMGKEKEEKVDVLEKLAEEVNELRTAKNLKALRNAWFTIKEKDLTVKELDYLAKLKDKRKDELS